MNKRKQPRTYVQRAETSSEAAAPDARRISEEPQTAPSPSIVTLQRYIGNSGMNALLARQSRAGGSGALQRDWLDDAADAVSDTAGGIVSTVSDAADSAIGTVTEAASGAYDAAAGAVSTAAGVVSDTLGLDGIVAKIETIVRTIQSEVDGQIDSLLSGIMEGFSGVEELATGNLSDIFELPPQIQEKAQVFVDKLMSGRGENTAELQALWDEWKPMADRFGEAIPSLEELKTRVETLESTLEPQMSSANELIESLGGRAEGELSLGNVTLPDLTPLREAISRATAALRAKVQALYARIRPVLDKVKRFIADYFRYWKLENIGHPWFWLNLVSANMYTELARAAFKAGYDHYLPRRFIDNYVDLGGTLTMDEKDMGQCAVQADVTAAEEFNFSKKITELFREMVDTGTSTIDKELKFSALAGAQTHGTLGAFHINFAGTLHADVDGWVFNGTMNFHDLWDFDYKLSDLLGFGGGHRTFYGELLTASAAEFLPGAGFNIESVNVPVTQKQGDAEATWSGKGIAGVPSRLARAIAGESTKEGKEKGGEAAGARRA